MCKYENKEKEQINLYMYLVITYFMLFKDLAQWVGCSLYRTKQPQ